MSELIFALGPNDRYFLCDGWTPYMNNLPQSLDSILDALADSEPDLSSLKFLICAFGPGESYILTMKHGTRFIIYHDGLPQKLVNWLFNPVSGAHLRDVATLKVTLGEDGAFFARDKDRYRWDGLPEGLEEFIQSSLSSQPAGMDMPRLVALGNGKSFAVVSAQGRIWYSATQKVVDAFDAIANSGQRGRRISLITMDAFSNESEFLVALDNTIISPLHHIKTSRLDLARDTKAFTTYLTSGLLEKEKQEAAQKQAAAERLTLASLTITPTNTAQGESRSRLDKFSSSTSQNSNNPSSQRLRDWDAVENNHYTQNYLSAPSQTLTSSRSHPDLRNQNDVMQMAGEQVLRQQQQALYMSQQVANSQAKLAAQVMINRASEQGAAAVLASVWG